MKYEISLFVLTWLCVHQASPRIRFNKEGTLLAVSTLDSGIKILANADGLRLLRTLENRSFDASRNAAETVTKVTPCNHNILRILSASMINQSLFMQPLINPLTAAANAAAASSSGTPAPAAITAMVCIYSLSHFS